jgi:hypothetical protein
MKTVRINNRTPCLNLLAIAVALLLTGSPARASDTDSISSEAYNRDLAIRRAESVQAYHIRQGVARDNLSENSAVDEMPVVNKQTGEGRRMNRRVDFIIMK